MKTVELLAPAFTTLFERPSNFQNNSRYHSCVVGLRTPARRETELVFLPPVKTSSFLTPRNALNPIFIPTIQSMPICQRITDHTFSCCREQWRSFLSLNNLFHHARMFQRLAIGVLLTIRRNLNAEKPLSYHRRGFLLISFDLFCPSLPQKLPIRF